jgi:hypothetical protein
VKATGALPNLISLQFHEVRRPSSNDFTRVFQTGNSANLVNLSLSGCTCVSDASVYIIARQCPQIHVLTLAHVESITDKGLESFLKHCSSLHYFDIYGMKNITGSSFACIPQYAPKLDFIIIEEFCGIEKEANLNALLRFNSKVQVHCTSSWKIGKTNMCKLLQ